MEATLLLRSMVRVAIATGIMAWGLFGTAATLDWPQAWWLLAVFLGAMLASMLYLWRANPEIFAVRRRFGKGTKSWDYLVIAGVVLGFTATLLVAGYGHRFGWPALPFWLAVAGYPVMITGIAGAAWAQAVNRHFEPSVRIQTDRGHLVVDTGPYAIVRHPGYIAGSLIMAGIVLALESLPALAPAALVIVMLMIRTLLEERVLRAELEGYAAYTQRVKYRWVPGVW